MVCIKQHLSNILSSIHQEVKQHWGWAEKGVVYKKKRVLQDLANQSTNYLMFVKSISVCTWKHDPLKICQGPRNRKIWT